MIMMINFVAFWAIMAFAISQGDWIGIILACAGFLFMHQQIEELYDNDK
jgi:hypothetical protein